MNKLLRLLPVLLFFAIVSPAYAMTTRGGQSVTVKEDETINGTLFAGGNSVTIDGSVHGDVICGAQTVVITGNIDGDVICGAQTIRITGDVTGSVRVAGQTVEISGPVDRNVMVTGQTLTIDQTGTVGGEILAAGQHVSIDSAVAGDVNVADESLVLGDNAKIAGAVHYQSKTVAAIAPSATIAGTITQTMPSVKNEQTPVGEVKKITRASGNLFGKIIFYFILAALAILLAPKRTKRILDLMKSSPGPMMLAGFVTVILVPVLIITMVFTLIGIPFAVLAGILFALALVLSEVFVSIFAGRFILTRFHEAREDSMVLNVLVGVPVVCLLLAIPILGGIAGFFGVIWGLGAMIESRKKATGKAK